MAADSVSSVPASTLAANQKFKLAAAATAAKSSPQALVNYLLDQMTLDVDDAMYADLMSYAGTGGAWTGSDAQLQTKSSGLAHLILGSPEYQFV